MIRRLVALVLAVTAPAHAADTGRFVEMAAVASTGIAPPHVVVWLPPGYDAGSRRYGVVYMHDGQNLFFPDRSNFNKVWAADKSALRVIAARRAGPFIIVGIDQPGAARFRQYAPQALIEGLPAGSRADFERLAGGPLIGDAYVHFLTDELKPLIDRSYRTWPDPAHTAIVGSSMGGLVSCYAFLRTAVFGRAGCVSSHWPLGDPAALGGFSPERAAAWTDFFAARLGRPAGRLLWMDHGTETLDASYAPYQQAIDGAIERAGWQRGRDFESRVYEGAAHEENAWRERLDDVFGFLLQGWK
jgi:predicted alpha/beta superfamily hydrolase